MVFEILAREILKFWKTPFQPSHILLFVTGLTIHFIIIIIIRASLIQ